MPNSRRPSFDDDAHSITSAQESFMDLNSPSTPDLRFSDFRRSRSGTAASDDSSSPILPSSHRTSSRRSKIRIITDATTYKSQQKPPLPTTPKPNFRRSISAEPSRLKGSASSVSPQTPRASRDYLPTAAPVPGYLPPTTNFLNPQERADLVRKSRKLAQVFGEIPSPLSVSPRQHESPVRVASGLASSRREAFSVSGGMEAIGLGTPVARTPPGSGRRYSTPLSPNESVLLSATGVERGGGGRAERRLRRESGGELVRESVWRGRREKGSRESEVAESASFIDLSDEERSDHDRSDHNDLRAREPGHAQNRPQRRSFSPSSSLSPSLNDLSPRDPQDDDRRRNREKLAKLHRFLGSRVPADLVLGPSDSEPALPLPMPTALATKERRHLRRRSSSAAELKSSWYDDVDRVKEDLDEREKAIIVRRAIKMEKMFGTQPPQTLYHTRHSPVPPTSPMTFAPMGTAERHERQTPSPGGTVSPSSPTSMRNMNQTAYINKGRSGKGRRQSSRSSHSESTQNLLLDHDGSSGSPHSPIQFSPGNRASSIYMHYRHSLNSLNDIIDRDDKESLAELHQYLTNSELRDVEARTPTGRFEDTKAIRSQRRRSLPTRSSTLSLASQFTLGPPPDSEMVMFQARRRRAAKLTNFFGVDYRDLIGDILDSIENGVEEEGHKGSLQPEEVRDLLQKLRNLKTKRSAAL